MLQAETDQLPQDLRDSKPLARAPAGLVPRLSQQVAFMQAEAEELRKVLAMAAAVAALLERCQEIERGAPPPQRTAPGADGLADPMASRAFSSIRAAASGVQAVQRHALQQLVHSTMAVAQRLSLAASLALGGLVEAADEGVQGELELDGDGVRGRVIQLRPEARRRPGEKPSGPEGDVPAGRPESSRPARPVGAEPPAYPGAPQVVALTVPRPLDGWLRALTRFYLPTQLGTGEPAAPAATRVTAESVDRDATIETRVIISGATGLSEMMVAYRALAAIEGVRDVSLNRVTPEAAELVVRHGDSLNLVAAAVEVMPAWVEVGQAGPGLLKLQVVGSRT